MTKPSKYRTDKCQNIEHSQSRTAQIFKSFGSQIFQQTLLVSSSSIYLVPDHQSQKYLLKTRNIPDYVQKIRRDVGILAAGQIWPYVTRTYALWQFYRGIRIWLPVSIYFVFSQYSFEKHITKSHNHRAMRKRCAPM